MLHNTEIRSLLDLSARIGEDPMLTQASTGNTSIKLEGTLWIKGSGQWLASARRENILVPVPLVDAASHCPSASIETAMHATLPHRVVAHVHSVNTIAWAVREDAEEQLGRLLEGMNWAWVPYVASGEPLARAVEKALVDVPTAGVFVLGNHGLVVAGDDCETVESLLHEVERRLAIAPRLAPEPDYGSLVQISNAGWSLPDEPDLHAFGTDEITRAILAGGLLYPCQAIFSHSLDAAFFQPVSCPKSAQNRPFVILESAGTLLSRTLLACEYAMLRGLVEVVQRIDPEAPIRYLTDEELGSGLHLDAYRLRAAAKTPDPCYM